MEYVIKTVEDRDTVLKIVQDYDVISPREDGMNLGTMICWHSRYNLGDKHNYSDPRDFLEDLTLDLDEDLELDSVENMSNSELMEIIKEHATILPLYLYDHSGITMKTSPFSCRWDSGQVGWIYITHNKFVKEVGTLDIEESENILNVEVKIYDQYLTGDVYGFLLESKEDGELIDSCWGLYGLDYISENIQTYLDSKYSDLAEKLKGA